MPTGYTYAVGEGEVTEFKDFALQCARAFGALIEMRDDPSDAPLRLPRASDYHTRELATAQKRLDRLQAMTSDEINVSAQSAYEAEVAQVEKYNANKRETEARYRAMLAHVDAWEPPSPEHHELKAFMRSQLTDSIDFDCRSLTPVPTKMSPAKWWLAEVEKATRSVAYNAKRDAEEKARVGERRAWIQNLLVSLGQPRLDEENVLPLSTLDALNGDDTPPDAA